MVLKWITAGKRATALVGVLLVVAAGVGMVALGGIAVDNPFTMNDSSTDTAGSDGTADEETTPADEENSTTPPESDSEPSDDRDVDNQTGDDRVADEPEANFVAGVRNFSISVEEFDASSADVEDGFVTPGEHRLLRFDTIIYNLGDADVELGHPENRSDRFEYSDSHNHSHLKGFNEYSLFDGSGNEMDVGKKQTFCLRDDFQARVNASSTATFDCDYQGISAGWADVYRAFLPGQYLVIDDLPDGEYTLHATTNAEGTIDEKCHDDNTVRVDLRIDNGTVSVLPSQNDYVKPPACGETRPSLVISTEVLRRTSRSRTVP